MIGLMIEFSPPDYHRVLPLVTSQNELSTLSVLAGNIPGKVFANDATRPTAALIQSPECNMVAGDASDEVFCSDIAAHLDLWDSVTPDSPDWDAKIPPFHPNKFVRPFPGRRYLLTQADFRPDNAELPPGYVMHKITDLDSLQEAGLPNADAILNWVSDWGAFANFTQRGAGYYIVSDDEIVSWSISDCCYRDRIAIGIKTAEEYRRQGLARKAASATITECFAKGYRTIEWLCVDSNTGSAAVAEQLGFRLNNKFDTYYSYLPTENPTDIPESEWNSWAQYLDESAREEPRLLEESLYGYLRANNVAKAREIIARLPDAGITPDLTRYQRDIGYFQSLGLCSNFGPDWLAVNPK